MHTSYKLVSDWNMKTDFSESFDTRGIVSIASDVSFSTSSNGGSYSVTIDSSDMRHGVFSKSSTYILYYFSYENDELSLQKIAVDGQDVRGISPCIGIKENGNIVVLYYDLNVFALSCLEENSGIWSVTHVDYVNMPLGIRRNISMQINGNEIHASYVYKFTEEQSAVQYAYCISNSWSKETVANDDGEITFNSVSLNLDSLGNPFVFVGGSSGVNVYEKRKNSWYLERQFEETAASSEIVSVYDALSNYSHLAYISNGEIHYQRYDYSLSRLLNRFLETYKFVDFNSNSISIDVSSSGQPIISYSHVEEDGEIFVSLKVARGSSYGDSFKAYAVDSSSVILNMGYLSDIVFDSNDKICILYYSGSVKLYDEQKDIDEDSISSYFWKDRTFVNNLVSSDSPPTRDSHNTYMTFDSSKEQYFFISDSDSTDLDETVTAFSILFSIAPSGLSPMSQTIVSKSSDDSGYEIYLGGQNGLTLSVTLNTIYGSLDTAIVDLIAGETAKIGVVYGGYDLKVYVKSPADEEFTVYRYDIFGDLKKTRNPFVIGAHGIAIDGEVDPYYAYPTPSESYIFSDFLDAKLSGLKYWKRELSFSEASYNDSDLVVYRSSEDPYSDNLDYSTFSSASGTRHFATIGNDLGVVDYGGIDKINLLSYSNFGAEDRVTNSIGYSIDPCLVKKRKGGMCLVWSDKQTGHAEIYANNFGSNHATFYMSNATSVLRCFGRNGKVVSGSNIFCDPKADFEKSGVCVGDFLSITSGTRYVGRRIPVVGILGKTCLEIGAYISETSDDLGYYVDSTSSVISGDIPIKLTDLKQNSINPAAVCDSENNIHIVFQSLEDENYQLYYCRYRPTNVAGQIYGSSKITSSIGNCINPSIAIDKDNVIHLAWEDTRNKTHMVMYGRSSQTNISGDDEYVSWNTSNLGFEDIVLSKSLYAEDPNIHVDSDGIVHVVFSARTVSSDNSRYEIYYCNNRNGLFTEPVRITEFNRKSRNAIVLTDKYMNVYVIFSCVQSNNVEDIYLAFYDFSERAWKSTKKISFSSSNSVMPSACIDSDGIIYIYWLEKEGSSSSIGFAKYNTILDRIFHDIVRPSSSPSTVFNLSVAMDESKTVFLSWEDGRFGLDYGTEIYRNESVNLINFDVLHQESSSQKTDSQIVIDQLSRFVIGKTYSDDVSASELPISQEILGDVVLTFETNSVSYEVPVDVFNSEDPLESLGIMVLDSRDIIIRIKGLPRTLAYRIKNADDTDASYSEFYEFTADVFPNTTIANWRLSYGNGAKTVALQLYTLQGLTSPIETTLYLNEPDIYDIQFFEDLGDSVGSAVSTEYEGIIALSHNAYWVKIRPHRVVGYDQKVVFDVDTLGTDISDVQTVFDGEYYVGKFSVNIHDGVRYIDGKAKIVPRIVPK